MIKTDFKAYYRLTKPGIIHSNVMTAAAGFLFASPHSIAFGRLLATLVGTGLIIASACVVNNYTDQEIDSKMARTQKRALVQGTISGRNALLFAAVVGLLGSLALILWVNWLTLLIGIAAFIDYVMLYGYTKRHSVHSTLVGTLSGSASIVAGYTGATGHFDIAAFLLFLIMTFWQMPHFYAIGIFRLKDYKAAGLPILPVKRGIRETQTQILVYTAAFMMSIIALTLLGYAGYTFLAIMTALNIVWLYRGLIGFQAADPTAWARMMFGFSLIVLLVMSATLTVATRLP